MPEAGKPLCRVRFFSFSVCGKRDTVLDAERGALLDIAEDLAKGANHSLYCLENGMIAADEKKIICIKTLDAPLALIGNPGIYLYRPEYREPQYPTVYAGLFNNMWGTNFPQWIGGDMEFRFEISCFDRKDADETKEWMKMLENCEKSVPAAENTGFPEGMKLIGTRKYGKGFCLYFAEIWGRNGERTFTAKGCRICLHDLMGRSGKLYHETISFDAAAYGVQCFYLEREDEDGKG